MFEVDRFEVEVLVLKVVEFVPAIAVRVRFRRVYAVSRPARDVCGYILVIAKAYRLTMTVVGALKRAYELGEGLSDQVSS